MTCGIPHTPSVFVPCFVQSPPQHSAFVLQTSPVCVQNDTWPEHRPLVQRLAQQSPFTWHALPAVRHDGLSGVQVDPPSPPPAPHAPPQQLAFDVHGWLSEMQSCAPQCPPEQTKVQHSLPVLHVSPATLHTPIGREQMCICMSQFAVQHSPSAAHV